MEEEYVDDTGGYTDVPVTEVEVWCGMNNQTGEATVGLFIGDQDRMLQGEQVMRVTMNPTEVRALARTLVQAVEDAEEGVRLRTAGVSNEEISERLGGPVQTPALVVYNDKSFDLGTSEGNSGLLEEVLGLLGHAIAPERGLEWHPDAPVEADDGGEEG